MSAEPEPNPDDVSVASPGASRARLALLVVCLAAWLLPWAEAFPDARVESGAERTGAPAALALVAAFGLAATAALARTRRGFAIGEAASSAALAAAVTALLAVHHPWIAGGARRSAWVPIFLPLALLACLDVSVRLRRTPVGREITAIRAGSAIVAGAALAVGLQTVGAAAALFLGIAPALSLAAPSAVAARRAVEALSLLLAVVLAFSQEIHAALEAVPPPLRGYPLPDIAFRAASLALALVALLSLRAAGRDAEATPAS